MRKLLIFSLLVLVSISFASAEVIQVSDGTDYGTSETSSYVLFHTLEFDSENGYDLINVTTQTDVTGGSSTQTIYYKITCSVDGGAEETLLETSFSQNYNDVVRTWTLEKETEPGQTLVLYEYMRIGNSFYAAYSRSITVSADLIPPEPHAIIMPTTPDNSYTSSLSYNVTGFGNMSATMYIDDISQGIEAIDTGDVEFFPDVSQGAHTWYVNVSAQYGEDIAYNQTSPLNFTFDSIDPVISSTDIDPDYDKIANGTEVNINIDWYDTNLKNAAFYVDYDDGSGYVLEDSMNFSSTSEWFNVSIDTTGYTGNNVSWYQIAYDEAGNSYSYNDTFLVILDELSIYVFDESTGDSILPEQVRVYNTDYSHFASIDSETNVSTLSYSDVETGKYIVSVTKDGYYARNSIIDVDITTLSSLNMYLIDTNQTVIYDQFILSDVLNRYEMSDCIIRLDKPMTDGTEAVYSTYFDYQGIAATYMIATDQYILYIITPDSTISYGWLTPDADGEVSIILNEFEFDDSEDWIQYTYSESNTSVSFDYESSKTVDTASMVITLDDSEEYNVTATTDTGSFIYGFTEDGTYRISITVTAEDGSEYVYQSFIEIGDVNQLDPFPDSYSIVLKSIIVAFVIVIGVLGCSAHRADLAAAWIWIVYAFAVYQDWVIGDQYSVSILGIIALAAIVKFHRKQSRSVN